MSGFDYSFKCPCDRKSHKYYNHGRVRIVTSFSCRIECQWCHSYDNADCPAIECVLNVELNDASIENA